MEQVKKLIGEPRNYGPTPEEKAEIDRKTLEEKVHVHGNSLRGNVYNYIPYFRIQL